MDDTLSVGEILALQPLRGAQVVGGRAGLGRRVRAVNVMEVPDILSWVRPEELLLTTAYPLRHHPERLGELLRQLDERDLAGVFLKPARYIDRVPPDMVTAADRLGFPLIALPADASFSEIINATLSVLLDNQATRLRRAQEIHDRFNDLVLTGGGFGRVARALSEALDRPVAVIDRDGSPRGATAGLSFEDLPRLPAMLPTAGDGHVGVGEFILQPIRANGEVLGAIFTTAAPRPLSDDEREALQYAATVSALHQVHARALAADEARARAIFLEHLVSEDARDWSAVIERAAAFGWDLRTPWVALVVCQDGSEAAASPVMGDHRDLRRLVQAIAATGDGRTIVWERTSEVAAFLPMGDLSAWGARGAVEEAYRRVCERLPHARLTIGFGRTAMEPSELPRSFAEARRALKVGRWSGGGGRVYGFGDLGVERLLADCEDAELLRYRNELIGPLLAHDARRRTDLLQTLDVYLATRNIAETARRLYLHSNTVRNQLARVEAVLGAFVGDAERCLSLALAVRVHRLAPTLQELGGSPA